ncbi:NAD-dependent epimerase/dehydratase family protein [Micromonospora sp. WMMD812]|uniref:NAD-dependent epimerase/dehydratase family protein n=1 Tax=Micromonospora sp. WMMD812 TaxID=3015152 RepID=UPI00248B8D42|nr:NAD-dependent epimerase/dehydratase family protein [Micromonospora sp. WMMD812]WBB67384.1 NAD-dependent epimerase/dehydratase family protein [Micromonospora sp. WMMD812]
MNQELHVVLGAGPAGTTLAEHLLGLGHRVRTVSRGGVPAVPGAEAVAADLTDAGQAAAAVAGAAVVYHCANVAYELQVEVMPRMQTAVLAGVAATGARLVVLDTLYPYGPTGGAVMTEQTPWRAVSRKGRMRAELDEAYLAAHRDGALSVVLGRSADFFGPRVFNSSLGGTVFPAAFAGGPVLALGDIDLPHSYSYLPDVAAGLARLGAAPEAAGRVWHLPTAPARSTREVHRLIERAVGGPFTVEALDAPRPWGPFDDSFMREYAELFYQYEEPQVMDSTAFETRFGVRPTPLADAVSATVDWFRAALAGRA